MAVKGSRKRGADRGEEPVAAIPYSGDPDELRRELLAMRAEQARELEEVRSLRRDLQEQVLLTHHLREGHLEHGARALERVQALTDRVEQLVAESKVARRNWLQSSEAAAQVVGRLEARMEEVLKGEALEPLRRDLATLRQDVLEDGVETKAAVARLSEGLKALEDGLPERLQALEARASADGMADRVAAVEGLADRVAAVEGLAARVATIEGLAKRLQALEDGLPGRLAEVGQGLEDRLSTLEGALRPDSMAALLHPLEEKLDARTAELRAEVEAVDLSALTEPLEDRLQVLAEELLRLHEKGSGAETGVLAPRLDRLEREFRQQAERLDEELEAVFEQNRLRVGEMTSTFDERMESLEAAAARVRELEQSTIKSRAEIGQVLQAAFDRLEALTGQLGRLEDQVVTPLPEAPEIQALKGSLDVLKERLQFLESRPLPQPMDPEALPRTEAGDPEEGLSTPEAAMAPPDDLDLRTRLFETVERMSRELEIRVMEPSLEALAQSEMLREECERLASDLALLSEGLGRQFAALWGRLQQMDAPRA